MARLQVIYLLHRTFAVCGNCFARTPAGVGRVEYAQTVSTDRVAGSQIENERHHWRQLSTTVDAVLLRVWKATLQEMEKCHNLLKSRSQAVQMVRLRLLSDVKLHAYYCLQTCR